MYQRDFTVETENMGMTSVHELKPNGASINLTRENRQEYVKLYCDWILNKSVEQQFKSFLSGFWDVAGGRTLEVYIL